MCIWIVERLVRNRAPVSSRLFFAIIGLAIAAFACGGDSGAVENTDYPYGAKFIDYQGLDHLQPGDLAVEYNSNPPTSGPHAASLAPWAVADTPIAIDVAVHNMEHGGVVIWYNCDGGMSVHSEEWCDGLRSDLSAIVQPLIDDGGRIVLTPYPDMIDVIALTAWQHVDGFYTFNEERIRTFIDEFECRFDPEDACA